MGGRGASSGRAGGRAGGGKTEKVVMNGKEEVIYSSAPKGYKKIDSLNTPNGISMYNNGKSRFSKEYKQIYVKTDKTKTAKQLVEESNIRKNKKAENHKNAVNNRYDRPQQQSTSSKRYQNRLQNKLKGYL